MNNRTEIDHILEQFKQRKEPQALSPRQMWRSDIDEAIAKLDWNGTSSNSSVIALLAGLHLMNDHLPASHSYSQQIEYESTGDYWHAIMHRMEQDYPNSKYWFRQAGNHPVKQEMPQKAAAYLQQHANLDDLGHGEMVSILKQFADEQGWSSDDFVDLVQMQESGQGTDETRVILEGLQRVEMLALLEYTYESLD